MSKNGDRPSLPEELAGTATSEVEVWDHPEWAPALDALEGWKEGRGHTGQSDTAPIAKLLRSGKPVPEAVARHLGLWLDPPWGRKGPRLVAVLPKRYYPGTKAVKDLISTKRKVEEAFEIASRGVV
jgi:hypothetical protein